MLNPLKLDGVESADVKVLAAKLAHINERTDTQGDYYKIGTLYGFNLGVKTENSRKDEFFKDNKFYIEGEGSIKYTYNNGKIAEDPNLAVLYFLHALKKIPSLIKKYETDTEKLLNDVPVLQEIVNSTWRKENELKELKTELAATDRKIQLSLKPVDQSEDKPSETEKNEGQKNRAFVANGSLNSLNSCNQVKERSQQSKEATGDRMVTGSIPKYHFENKSKRIKTG
jgi:hypothetical protein